MTFLLPKNYKVNIRDFILSGGHHEVSTGVGEGGGRIPMGVRIQVQSQIHLPQIPIFPWILSTLFENIGKPNEIDSCSEIFFKNRAFSGDVP